MTCPICFFRDEHQRNLKTQTFKTKRFEDKLEKYKDLFISEVNNLTSISNCKCHSYENRDLTLWTDDLIKRLQQETNVIISVFDNLISIYKTFVDKNQFVATAKLWEYLKREELLNNGAPTADYIRPYFRGRFNDGFNPTDPKELFHIPFTKRELIGSQRFSVNGQPMLYLASSLLTASKELETDIKDLSVAAFIPFFSMFYPKGVYDLKNYMNDLIEGALPGLFASTLTYENYALATGSDNTVEKIKQTILMQVCTFPREHTSKNFVAEYALPQMLTTTLMEHRYAGIVFPSTKDFTNLAGHHKYSKHHVNLVLFVSYCDTDEYDEDLFDNLFTFTLDGREKFQYTTNDIVTEIENNRTFVDQSSKNNNDFILPYANYKLHLEYVEKSTIDGVPYFQTEIGKIELELAMKLIMGMREKIKLNNAN